MTIVEKRVRLRPWFFATFSVGGSRWVGNLFFGRWGRRLWSCCCSAWWEVVRLEFVERFTPRLEARAQKVTTAARKPKAGAGCDRAGADSYDRSGNLHQLDLEQSSAGSGGGTAGASHTSDGRRLVTVVDEGNARIDPLARADQRARSLRRLRPPIACRLRCGRLLSPPRPASL